MEEKELKRKIGTLWLELMKSYKIFREELEDLLDELEDVWEAYNGG